MKKGISRTAWVDLTDGHEYRVNDAFPHDNRAIPDKRWKEVEKAGMVTVVDEPVKKVK